MEQVVLFIKYLLSSNFINFIFMVVILLWISKKMNLAELINQGITKTEEEINNSVSEKEDAGKKFCEIQKEADNLPQKLKQINDEISSNIKMFQETLDKDTDSIVDSIKKNIDKTLMSEEKRVSSNLMSETVLKTVEQAKNKIEQELEKNNDLQSKFVDMSISELERIEL